MESLFQSSSSNSLSSSEDDDMNLKAITEAKRVLRKRLITLLSTFIDGPCQRVPASTSPLPGSLFIRELLNGSSNTCYELMRMQKNSFIYLCQIFREKNWLANSKHVNVEEKIAMFLITMSHNLRNRLIKNRFQHSGQTVHKFFHEVLVVMLKFSKEMTTPPSFNDNTNGIANHRLRQIFKDAVGAIDGTLIHGCIPIDKQVPYMARGRGECFQNVMAICDFDMVSKYVVVGWEGTTQESRILTKTIRDPNHNFPMLPNGAFSNTKKDVTILIWYAKKYSDSMHYTAQFSSKIVN
ncbi:hypothetical protein Ddye_013477 [Dipteronia dyeriana]|uniref:DUF8040 domain-containing protein n=1 Tax=Dipteronia dyeriana TaxID=168575 RepID=A0AAE0CJP0_9ROSI|nr:hypothetical protein Ddye_013477 [Dipteronia dyeriana]